MLLLLFFLARVIRTTVNLSVHICLMYLWVYYAVIHYNDKVVYINDIESLRNYF